MSNAINTEFLNTQSIFYGGHNSTHIERLDEYSIPLYSIDDLCISSTGSKKIYVDDDVFIVAMPESVNHLHMMLDVFGQYFILKTIVPKIKMYIILKNFESTLGSAMIERFILNHFKIDRSDYIMLDSHHSITFKKVYFVETLVSSNILTDLIRIPQVAMARNDGQPSTYTIAIHKLIRDNFKEYMSSPNKNKKIFLSRLNDNRSIRSMYNKNNGEKNINLGNAEAVREISSKSHMTRYTRNCWGRHISLSDEIYLENFFETVLGYSIIDGKNYPIEDQISAVYGATHITGLVGAAFINSIFCNEEARVIMLSVSDIKNYPFKLTPMSVDIEHYSIPESVDTDEPNAVKFTADQIIDMVLENKYLFI